MTGKQFTLRSRGMSRRFESELTFRDATESAAPSVPAASRGLLIEVHGGDVCFRGVCQNVAEHAVGIVEDRDADSPIN